MDHAQCLHRIVGFESVVSQLLGAPLGVVPLPRVGHLPDLSSARQLRKLGIEIFVAAEFLSFQQRLYLAHAPLGRKTRKVCGRWRNGLRRRRD